MNLMACMVQLHVSKAHRSPEYPRSRDQTNPSSKLGRISCARKPSEDQSSTRVRPFMKAIFSSRGLEANVDRPIKLRVEMGSEWKNRFVESVEGVGCEARYRARAGE